MPTTPTVFKVNGVALDVPRAVVLRRVVCHAHRGMPSCTFSVTGKPLQAVDAHRLGVINRLVPAEKLEDEVRELAGQLASQPKGALAAAKRAVNHALESSYEEALEFESYLQEAQAASPEFVEGVQAFLAKRSKK